MATVYLVHDPRFKRDVVLKVLGGQFLENTHFRARFEREAQAIAAIAHPAIEPVGVICRYQNENNFIS